MGAVSGSEIGYCADSVKNGNIMVLHNRTVILWETKKTEHHSIKPEQRYTFVLYKGGLKR